MSPKASDYRKLLDSFLWEREADGRAPKTVRYYRDEITMCADWLTAREIDPLKATSTNIRQWFQHLASARGRNRGGQHANYRALRAWYNWLIEEEMIDRSPLKKIELSGEHRVVEPFSAKEIVAVLKAAGETRHPLRDTLIVTLLIETGVRLGELAGISVDDLDTRVLTVRGKGNKERKVPLSPDVGKSARRYLLKERPDPFQKDEGALLLADTGGALTADGIGEVVYRLGVRAKVPHCHPHRFRHTYATAMAGAVPNAWVLASLLGHTGVQITSRYVNARAVADGAANLSVLKMLQEKKK